MGGDFCLYVRLYALGKFVFLGSWQELRKTMIGSLSAAGKTVPASRRGQGRKGV